MDFLKNAQTFQKTMSEMKAKLEAANFEGNAAGGKVKLMMNGKGEVKKLDLDTSLINPSEKEILEDSIVAACNDARGKVEDTMKKMMSGPVGSLPFKFPF